MRKYYERTRESWKTHDWSTLLASRLWYLICDFRPSAIRLLGRGPESYSDEEWRQVEGVVSVLAAIQTCHEAFPFDGAGYATVEEWLQAAAERKVIGETERERLVRMLHEQLVF